MTGVLDWLQTNAEWVFGGVGVAVPIAVVSWLAARNKDGHRQVQRGGKGSTNLQAGKSIRIEDRSMSRNDERNE